MQADIEHITEKMTQENYRFEIVELGGILSKEDRIKRLVPLAEEHRIWLPDHCIRQNYEGVQEDLVRVFVDDERLTFPLSLHEDMLDCLCRICDDDMGIVFPKEFALPMQTQAINDD